MTSTVYRPRLRRTCAYTKSSSWMKRMERRPPNSSIDRCATNPRHCTLIFTIHNSLTFNMCACTITLIGVESVSSRYENAHPNYIYTSARVRRMYAESTRVARTTRFRKCLNVWKMRTFESPNRCATTRTAHRLTLSIGLTLHKFRRIVTMSNGHGIERTRTRASAISRYGRRRQQVGGRHDGDPTSDE